MFFRAGRSLVHRPLFSAAVGTMGASSCLFAYQHQYTRTEHTPKPKEGLSKEEFRPLTCIENVAHTHNTRKITFSLPGGATGPFSTTAEIDHPVTVGVRGMSGACVNVVLKAADTVVEADGSAVKRPYNPLDNSKEDSLTLLVKVYPDAKMGSFLRDLKEGDTVEALGPNPQFTHFPGYYTHYGFLAGGTGVTPLIQLSRYILSHSDTEKVTLVSFNNTSDDVLLKDEMDQMAEDYSGRFTVHHVVAEPAAGSGLTVGTPSPKIIKDLMPAPDVKHLVVVAGPKGMVAAVAGPRTNEAQFWGQGPLGGMMHDLGYEFDMVWKI